MPKRHALRDRPRATQVHGGNPADGVAYEGATVLDAKQARVRMHAREGSLLYLLMCASCACERCVVRVHDL